ncbi:MAG: hypothetical protein ACXQT5_04705 [Candidatus Syntropharchaeia archaeon]
MDLEILNLNTREKEILKRNGIRTVESLALLTPHELPFSRGKSEVLVQHARNTILFSSIEEIEILSEEVRVKFNRKINPVIEVSTKSILNLDNPFTSCGIDGDTMIITPKWGSEIPWLKKVLPQIEKWKFVFDSAREEEMKEKMGVNIVPSEIEEFARKKGFDGFWKDVFEDIRENNTMKQAITASLFSSLDEPVHLLIVGPPASAKTLARDIISENFSGLERIGGNSTRAGLVINYATGELGALAYADGKIVLADEFDKVPRGDVEHIYELMSNGICEVHSGRIHKTIRSRFILIATMNPSREVFSSLPMEDIGLPPTLISRFGLIVRTDDLGKEERVELFRKKFYHGNKLKKFSAYFDAWIKLSKEYVPEITANSVEKYLSGINEIVEEFCNTPLRRDNRMGEYARNIAFSIARCEFRDVDDDVLEKSWKLIEKSIRDWI